MIPGYTGSDEDGNPGEVTAYWMLRTAVRARLIADGSGMTRECMLDARTRSPADSL